MYMAIGPTLQPILVVPVTVHYIPAVAQRSQVQLLQHRLRVLVPVGELRRTTVDLVYHVRVQGVRSTVICGAQVGLGCGLLLRNIWLVAHELIILYNV